MQRGCAPEQGAANEVCTLWPKTRHPGTQPISARRRQLGQERSCAVLARLPRPPYELPRCSFCRTRLAVSPNRRPFHDLLRLLRLPSPVSPFVGHNRHPAAAPQPMSALAPLSGQVTGLLSCTSLRQAPRRRLRPPRASCDSQQLADAPNVHLQATLGCGEFAH